MKDKKVNINSKETAKKIFTRKEQDLQLKEQLLIGADMLISSKGTDENLDKLSLKIKLYSGKEFFLEDYILNDLAEYSPRFYKDFYYQFARLKGIPKELMDVYRKPRCVASFTKEFIYGRFPYKVLKVILAKSVFIFPGVRANKLFQYLTPSASEQLDLFIMQAVETMKKCDNLTEFKLMYSKDFKVYAQVDMFDDKNTF